MQAPAVGTVVANGQYATHETTCWALYGSGHGASIHDAISGASALTDAPLPPAEAEHQRPRPRRPP
jgi:hypothetical protein